MIKLTRLNGDQFVVNAELIKFIEEKPDTIITLQGGEKLMVKDPVDDIIAKAVDFSRLTRSLPDQLH